MAQSFGTTFAWRLRSLNRLRPRSCGAGRSNERGNAGGGGDCHDRQRVQESHSVQCQTTSGRHLMQCAMFKTKDILRM